MIEVIVFVIKNWDWKNFNQDESSVPELFTLNYGCLKNAKILTVFAYFLEKLEKSLGKIFDISKNTPPETVQEGWGRIPEMIHVCD